MKRQIITYICLCCLVIPALAAEIVQSEVESVQKDLLSRFDILLKDTDAYARLVTKECRGFPEGDLFPYTFPAMAYCAINKEDSEGRAWALISQARKVVSKRMGMKLLELKEYHSEGTYLGQLNLALSIFNQKYDNKEAMALNSHLSNILMLAFKERKFKDIASFPNYSWTFDSIPALLSIKLDKSTDPKMKKQLIESHLQWIKNKATHAASQLPYSRVGNRSSPPRGCDLSLRIPMIHALDPVYAKQLYESYCKYFWIESGLLSGFKEWETKASQGDIDSGPIIMGLGTSATAMSYPCLTIFKDDKRIMVYENYLSMAPMVKGIIKKNSDALGVELDGQYYTGLLFGDCVLFYVLNWEVEK